MRTYTKVGNQTVYGDWCLARDITIRELQKECKHDGEMTIKITKEATLKSTGIRTYTCKLCGKLVRTEVIPKKAPSIKKNVTYTLKNVKYKVTTVGNNGTGSVSCMGPKKNKKSYKKLFPKKWDIKAV